MAIVVNTGGRLDAVGNQFLRANQPIVDRDGNRDLIAINRNINTHYAYERVLGQAASMVPMVNSTGAYVEVFRIAVRVPSHRPDYTFVFYHSYCGIRVTATADNGGNTVVSSDVASAEDELTLALSTAGMSFTADRILTIEVEVRQETAVGGNEGRLYAGVLIQDGLPIATIEAGGLHGSYRPIDDDVFDEDEPLDFFTSLLARSIEYAVRDLANRSLQFYPSQILDNQNEYQLTPHHLSSVSWHADGPYMHKAGRGIDEVRVVLRLQDLGAAYEHGVTVSVGAEDETMAAIRSRAVTTSADGNEDIFTFSGIPVRPGEINRLYVFFICKRETLIAETDAVVSWPESHWPSGHFYFDGTYPFGSDSLDGMWPDRLGLVMESIYADDEGNGEENESYVFDIGYGLKGSVTDNWFGQISPPPVTYMDKPLEGSIDPESPPYAVFRHNSISLYSFYAEDQYTPRTDAMLYSGTGASSSPVGTMINRMDWLNSSHTSHLLARGLGDRGRVGWNPAWVLGIPSSNSLGEVMHGPWVTMENVDVDLSAPEDCILYFYVPAITEVNTAVGSLRSHTLNVQLLLAGGYGTNNEHDMELEFQLAGFDSPQDGSLTTFLQPDDRDGDQLLQWHKMIIQKERLVGEPERDQAPHNQHRTRFHIARTLLTKRGVGDAALNIADCNQAWGMQYSFAEHVARGANSPWEVSPIITIPVDDASGITFESWVGLRVRRVDQNEDETRTARLVVAGAIAYLGERS